ncbi:MAG: DUF1844 domain-containing protein [Tepidisphaerales bacterium]
MSENILHIDDDWKRQAQEEKRRLAEEEARKKAEATTAPAGVRPTIGGAGPGGAGLGGAGLGGATFAGESASTATAGSASGSTAGSGRGEAGRGEAASGRRRAAVPQASFAGLVQTLMTQALFYLGDLGTRSGQTVVDLDLAKLQIDLLGVLEEKTRGNLTDAEKQLLDNALYEVRMRFVSVAREYATV